MWKSKRFSGKEQEGILKQSLELLFPEKLYCIACGAVLEDGDRKERDWLCASCRERLLQDTPQRCCLCGRFLNSRKESLLCADCRGQTWVLDQGVVCCEYKGDGKQMVMRLKYGGKGYLAKPMGHMMAERVKHLPEFDLILPVPMYRKKEKIRGYNQAELLARSIEACSGKPCLGDGLERVRETAPMSGLSREERKKTIQGAIRVKRAGEIRGKKVLLVDDIFTTGSTGQECGSLLKKNGAEKVFFAAFAATPAGK